MIQADYVIVGAGSAGCVLANRLTESGHHSVVLLEAGQRDRNPWIHIPIGYGKLFADGKHNWMFSSEPEPELGGSRIAQPRGKVLGGLVLHQRPAVCPWPGGGFSPVAPARPARMELGGCAALFPQGGGPAAWRR